MRTYTVRIIRCLCPNVRGELRDCGAKCAKRFGVCLCRGPYYNALDHIGSYIIVGFLVVCWYFVRDLARTHPRLRNKGCCCKGAVWALGFALGGLALFASAFAGAFFFEF